MTREENIKWLESLKAEIGKSEHRALWHYAEAIDIAIDALQFVEHFDLLKEYQSLQEVVYCKDCRYQAYCYQTVSHNKTHDGFNEYWSEPIDFCSKGEMREE